ncbi:hypothetical protein J6590_036881 [Homalodisca vitripennis]|nr:hypothetical protein J6590_036881 [Homalodisca vitripennis]
MSSSTSTFLHSHTAFESKEQVSSAFNAAWPNESIKRSAHFGHICMSLQAHDSITTTSTCETVESKDLLQSCTNGMCVNKLTERCCFCLDCCSCPDFCQVEDDQMVADKYISCNEHKSFIAFWEEAHTTDWHRVVKDHEMPYDPVCWRSNCGKKALIICVCKTRAYCGFKCREEDWNESHHKTCSGSTDPSLFYSNTC